ncbi:hypothetical protein Vretimale_8721 [Volvox reticuliferus]|uniref:MAGE domain-containing protein n=1 Tax=Volvox reticuliferus TaxID=1737510 RepID=A0A8J4GCA4_9CHLO|nr:hypothetical protein Vretimale_8721 [Volvox reticuliferus]
MSKRIKRECTQRRNSIDDDFESPKYSENPVENYNSDDDFDFGNAAGPSRRGSQRVVGASRGGRAGAAGAAAAGHGPRGAARGRGQKPAGSDGETSDVIIIDSDSVEDDGGGGGGGGGSSQPARGGRSVVRGRGGGTAAAVPASEHAPVAGGRGRGRGHGRGRGRGSQPMDLDAGPGSDGEEDPQRGAGGAGGAGGTQQQRRVYTAPTVPLEIVAEELATMRRLIRRYRDEWEAAREKCASWDELSSADKDLLAGSVLRFMLFSARAKPGHPIPRARLNAAIKEVLGSNRHLKSKTLGAVWLPWARYKAITSLGYDIVELVRPRGGAAVEVAAAAADGATAGEGNQYYVLRTVLPTALRCEFVDGCEGTRAEDGAKMVILALIMQNGGKMQDDELHRYMSMMGFPPDRGQPHPQLGSFDDLINQMKDQRYLCLDKQGQGAGVMWGEGEKARAHTAIIERRVI